MSTNTILTASVIAKEALMILTNNLVFVKNINRAYEKEFSQNVNGYKKGASVTIRKPARFAAVDGAVMDVQNFTEQSTSLSIDKQKHIGVSFTSADLTLHISEFSKRVLEPQMVELANTIDTDALSMYKQVNNLVGTPGSPPNSFMSLGAARQRLIEMAAPSTGLKTILNPAAAIRMADSLKGLNYREVVGEALETGLVSEMLHSKVYESAGIRQHLVGPLGGTPTVASTPSEGATGVATQAWTSAAANRLKKGDVITFAGVYAVNPYTRETTGTLCNFTVTEDFDSDGAGNGTVQVYPALYSSGPLQTVSAMPAPSAAVTVLTGTASTSYAQNLMFHPNAFAFASVPLELPKDAHFAAQESYEGISLRVWQQSDIFNDARPCRVDVLYGYKCVYPELACRITG